ncbi:hypothetical protein ACU610_21260 [Geodermatophilus sp. URMC 61]|uniref:hypothetical protein n=1 Tax=Geodermatophilus sp. URMC 61 TaxID=3423411 RepID=UPI00406D15B0
MPRLPEPSQPPDVCDACGRDRPLYRLEGADGDYVHRCADCLRNALVEAEQAAAHERRLAAMEAFLAAQGDAVPPAGAAAVSGTSAVSQPVADPGAFLIGALYQLAGDVPEPLRSRTFAAVSELERQRDEARTSLRIAEESVVRQRQIVEVAIESTEEARRWALAMWGTCGTPWASNSAPELPVPAWLPPDGLEPLFPGIEFRDGPTGRRAAVIGGPDVREIVRAVEGARVADPELSDHELLTVVETNTGVPRPQLRTALDFRRAWPRIE